MYFLGNPALKWTLRVSIFDVRLKTMMRWMLWTMMDEIIGLYYVPIILWGFQSFFVSVSMFSGWTECDSLCLFFYTFSGTVQIIAIIFVWIYFENKLSVGPRFNKNVFSWAHIRSWMMYDLESFWYVDVAFRIQLNWINFFHSNEFYLEMIHNIISNLRFSLR